MKCLQDTLFLTCGIIDISCLILSLRLPVVSNTANQRAMQRKRKARERRVGLYTDNSLLRSNTWVGNFLYQWRHFDRGVASVSKHPLVGLELPGLKITCFKMRQVEPVEQDEQSPLSVVLPHSQPSSPFSSSHLVDHLKAGRIQLEGCSKVNWATVTSNMKQSHDTTSCPV